VTVVCCVFLTKNNNKSADIEDMQVLPHTPSVAVASFFLFHQYSIWIVVFSYSIACSDFEREKERKREREKEIKRERKRKKERKR
jgi:hypothetical protein